MEVDWVKITPYYENGDMPEDETYPNDGWEEYEDSTTPTEPTMPNFFIVKNMNYLLLDYLIEIKNNTNLIIIVSK